VDKALRHRVNAARVVVRNQILFFRRQLGEVSSEWKADDTRVTFADFAISEQITRELLTSFPEDTCLSEESGLVDEEVKLKNKYTWILDPVDGTNNYALGVPFCAISLALLKEGRPVYGFLYDGCRNELLEGGGGSGLRADGSRLQRTSRPFEPRSGILALHFPLSEKTASALFPLLRTYRVRCLGSAALQLAYVATGKLDGALDERVKVWDIAAAVALLEGAGCPYRFLGESPFPLERFSLEGPFCRIAAGSEEFLQALEKSLP
jgi:myo-inositol-1(or 4)-monophosphatase